MRKNAQQAEEDRELLTPEMPQALGDRARELLNRVQEETQEHPLRTVGWAATAGFVLGGGLFTPLTGRTLRAGLHVALRLAVLPALTRGLAEMAGGFFEDSGRYRTKHQEAEETT
jgi:hypothetical protein